MPAFHLRPAPRRRPAARSGQVALAALAGAGAAALLAVAVAVAVAVVVAFVAGCDSPAVPDRGREGLQLGPCPVAPDLARELSLVPGRSAWSWRLLEAGRPRPESGRAELTVAGDAAIWRLEPAPPASSADSLALVLEPAEPELWHSQRTAWPPSGTDELLPLPRVPADSPQYADLLALLQELTEPRFAQVVTQWPALPVPVRAAAAPSGALDLAECLHEAVDIWNEGEPEPVFVWDPEAGWGVRLVHLPGTIQSPPLGVALVRLDAQRRPLRLHIVAGDNYDGPEDRRCAVRALAHELAHARLLWGHSRERSDLLWRWGPIVPGPSPDERRAARLLAVLPAGLDLRRYGRPEATAGGQAP